jgi:hypothetical protein
VKWRELHPTENLALSGNNNLVRGITFNTKGFNFSNFILSACHMKDIADLLQLSGRANGGKEFVAPMTIHCPEPIWAELHKWIDILSEIHNKNPDEFEERHFRPLTARDIREKAWTVPHVFSIGAERYTAIKKLGKSKQWDKETIFAEIAKDSPELVSLLQQEGRSCFQVSEPQEGNANSYKKYIQDFVEKADKKDKFNMGVHKDDSGKDGFQIFLDRTHHRVIVSVYNGSLLPKE